jgi:hypothetical protein
MTTLNQTNSIPVLLSVLAFFMLGFFSPAYATSSTVLRPAGSAASFVMSGMVNPGQVGPWELGLANQSSAGAEVTRNRAQTWGNTVTEAFGRNFLGLSTVVGTGRAFGQFGPR